MYKLDNIDNCRHFGMIIETRFTRDARDHKRTGLEETPQGGGADLPTVWTQQKVCVSHYSSQDLLILVDFLYSAFWTKGKTFIRFSHVVIIGVHLNLLQILSNVSVAVASFVFVSGCCTDFWCFLV